ncbi:hypothetical protein AK812_SmicGene12645 [Symbiodinium microadriaticum]|uniref:Uncharacterized protein n=1 Tax=Symbiodinium microadriaticum TaxID=2951 RepID=A0A1Q9EA37_SYMMI|nr:hypothetical protein AK812_SmicGene12645 [Symbiodinium microadriaticum]
MHVQSTQMVDPVFFGTIIDEQTVDIIAPRGRLEENHVRSVQGETGGESMMRVAFCSMAPIRASHWDMPMYSCCKLSSYREDPFIKIGETIVQIAFWNFMNVRGNVAKSWVGDGFSMVSISGDSMDDATWCTITKEEDFGTVAAKLDSLVRTNYRIYTATFGKNLLKAYTSWLATPAGDRANLRGREVVDLSLSDREIFEGLQGEDEWIESGMHEVFEYLYRGTRLACWDLTVSAKSSLQCRHRPV